MAKFALRDWLRKRLDKYEERYERSDEEFASVVIRNVDALSNRRALWFYLAVLLASNTLVWFSVIIFPRDIKQAWEIVTNLDDKIAFLIISIVFGLGMWLTYALFRLKFPDLEDPDFNNEMLASFSYSLHSTKRWRVWLVSVIGGVLNVLLLIFAEIFLTAGL